MRWQLRQLPLVPSTIALPRTASPGGSVGGVCASSTGPIANPAARTIAATRRISLPFLEKDAGPEHSGTTDSVLVPLLQSANHPADDGNDEWGYCLSQTVMFSIFSPFALVPVTVSVRVFPSFAYTALIVVVTLP